VNASPTDPDSPDLEAAARKRLYRVLSKDPMFCHEVIPEAVGILRSLASMNHGDTAQDRAREALERIDTAVIQRGTELGLWRT
jgi:hypothetical protein